MNQELIEVIEVISKDIESEQLKGIKGYAQIKAGWWKTKWIEVSILGERNATDDDGSHYTHYLVQDVDGKIWTTRYIFLTYEMQKEKEKYLA